MLQPFDYPEKKNIPMYNFGHPPATNNGTPSSSDPHQLTYYQACILTFHLAFYFDIFSNSSILFGIYYALIYVLQFCLTFYLSVSQIFWRSLWRLRPAVLTSVGPWRLKTSGAHFAPTLAVEVQWCSLRSDWQLRSSGAHCARTLAVEVQWCSLRSGPGG